MLIAAALAVVIACSDDGDDGERGDTPTAAPSARAVEGWTMLGFDLSSTFHNDAETSISADTADGLTVAWTFDAGGFVASTPAVSAGRVYVVSARGTFALDATTGAEIWRNTALGGTASPALAEGELYVNTGGAILHRLDPETGEIQWQAEIDAHERASGFSSPVLAGNLVIVGSSSTEEVIARDNATFRGSIVAFDRDTGREVWRHYTVDPPHNGVAMWSTPTIDLERGLVFGSTGNNYTEEAGPTSDSVFAVHLETGEVAWNTQLSEGDVFTIPNPRSPDSDFGTNPVLFEAEIDGERRALVGAGQKSGMFWVLDRETGDVVWSRQVSGGSALIGGVFNNGAFDGERIIVAGNNGTSSGPGSEPSNGASRPLGGANTTTSVLMAMDPATGDVLWERQLPAWVWAPITLANGVGYVSADSDLQAFNLATGERLALIDTEGTIATGAAIWDGRVYFGSGLAYLGTTLGTKLYALDVP
jgi:polyvinyl alcohol dehydrogenase (cytochrome)